MNRLEEMGRTHSRSSTDDVHSMCSQLSGMEVRNFQAPQIVSRTSLVIRIYEEPAFPLPPNPQFSSIRLAKTHSVMEFAQFGDLPTFKKQAGRSTNNPWRRYGAMRKLSETGGYAPNGGSKKERKKRESLIPVKPNVKLPPTPQCPQMSLNKCREPGIYEKKLDLQVPKTIPVDHAAQELARQLKVFILEHGVELMNDDSGSVKNHPK